MADSKISNLDALAAVDLDTTNDLVAVVDTSATQTKKISVGEVLGNLSTLNAIDTSITATAVDVFVYDTSKDSDGGAWRKRCQHTSWYNETLNTATRGSRREFPAVAVIVAESNKVTIYDGDDPSLPMWMVLVGVFSGLPSLAGGYIFTSVAAAEGEIVAGSTLTLNRLRFIADECIVVDATSFSKTARANANIAGRGIPSIGATQLSTEGLVSRIVNDVAITVLPDAPIDPATGLPVPTIAVATDGGVSVIKDDGTVVDITYGTYNITEYIGFRDDNSLTFTAGLEATTQGWVHVFHDIPTSDIADPHGYVKGSSDEHYAALYSVAYNLDLQWPGQYPLNTLDVITPLAWGSAGNLIKLAPNKSNPSKGMLSAITSNYTTGWMNGDIKGAFLADTDDTDLVGSSVVSEDFASGVGGFTAVNEYAVVSNVSGRLRVASNDASQYGRALRSFTTVVGKTYVVEMENFAGSGGAVFYVGSSAGGAQYGYYSGSGVKRVTFKANTTTSYITCYSVPSTNYAEYDNLTVKLADADRSVNNKGLIVNGTVTRSPVATGAELVAYSGFSASNYLEQPYNSALDFGTGDFCVMGWIKQAANTAVETILERDSATTAQRFTLAVDASGFLTFTCDDDTTARTSTSNRVVDTDTWTYFAAIYDGAGNVSLYLDGALDDTETGSALLTLDNTAAVLSVGLAVDGAEPLTNGDVALLRISATAPTPDQIAKIYEDERKLFMPGAQCALYGTSDDVTALAHDPKTNLLHVGTSAGRSTFDGLVRVANTTTPVATAISAVNGLIAEQ